MKKITNCTNGAFNEKFIRDYMDMSGKTEGEYVEMTADEIKAIEEINLERNAEILNTCALDECEEPEYIPNEHDLDTFEECDINPEKVVVYIPNEIKPHLIAE